LIDIDPDSSSTPIKREKGKESEDASLKRKSRVISGHYPQIREFIKP